GGFTLALIDEATLLRRLLNSDNPSAPRMRRWLTHGVLPAIQRSHGQTAPQEASTIEAIRRQTAAAVLREADEIIELTGVSHAQALLSALERIQANGLPASEAARHRVSSPRADALHAPRDRQVHPSWPGHPHLLKERARVGWLTTDQLADRLDRTLRSTNQRLAASGLQLRNDEDDWQLTEAGRDWGVALPLCSRGERRLQILWDPAVVSLLEGEG
ncbi:hypothetical protein H6G65_18625, partial [Microcystis elabens FACHB-917]|nr:hypothetical protein [Microcystis elabens FACHB-917]